jgi:ferric-dicitrate binding protein FerR (iron transport regulator)
VGEIYLEVVKDRKPFIVNTSDMNITVYGTAFNVSAYADRHTPSVVLVEGKVGVKNTLSGEEMMMMPKEMVSLQNNRLNRETVDIRKYTSWKDGYLLLDRTPVTEVLKYMEQYYNLSFDIKENVNLRDITCTGKIYLTPNLDDIMKTVSLLSSTKYTRENNKIYIQY